MSGTVQKATERLSEEWAWRKRLFAILLEESILVYDDYNEMLISNFEENETGFWSVLNEKLQSI